MADNSAKLDEDSIRASFASAKEAEAEPVIQWPDPPDDAALHGPAGDLVRAIRDQTESDPAAILIQFLVAVGNAFGRSLYRMVEATRHHPNLFLALVGPSAKGRKGTAWDWCVSVVAKADPTWALRLQTGLSSGEGVIHAVRDPTAKEPGEGGGRKGKRSRATDPGVTDKRALFIQPEFSAVLKVCGREGNTLSDILRAAWDGKDLQVASKNSGEVATAPHISLVSHISREELRSTLADNDAANGFGNRFLWACAKRANILPFGGKVKPGAIDPIISSVAQALAFARANPGEFGFEPRAADVWGAVYPSLSADRTGLAGAILSRAEAQTLRLAMLYAALDATRTIELEHLEAALALWEYCERSAAFIFHDKTGNPLADEILSKLLGSQLGLSRTEIHNALNRHSSAGEIDQALGALQALGLAVKASTKTQGRPEERWYANKKGSR